MPVQCTSTSSVIDCDTVSYDSMNCYDFWLMTYDSDDWRLCLDLLLLPWVEFWVQIQVQQIGNSRCQVHVVSYHCWLKETCRRRLELQGVKKKFRERCSEKHLDMDFAFFYSAPRNGRKCHNGFTLDPIAREEMCQTPVLSAGSSGPYAWPTSVISTGKNAAASARSSGTVKEARTAQSDPCCDVMSVTCHVSCALYYCTY